MIHILQDFLSEISNKKNESSGFIIIAAHVWTPDHWKHEGH